MTGQMDARTRPRASRYAMALILLLLAGGILAMVLTASTSSSSGLTFVPGGDSRCSVSPVYPCASVSIDGTGTVATMGISFPRSNLSTPQPAVYYTDLVEVHDLGTVSNTIASLNVTDVTGAPYLGRISIYYCTAQTDDPASSPDCASFSIVGSSGGYLSGNNVLPSTLNPGGVAYIEVIAFASSTSSVADVVTFVLDMSTSFQPITSQQGASPPPASTSSTSTSTSASTVTSAVSKPQQTTVTLTATSTATSTSITTSTSVVTMITTTTATSTTGSTTTSTTIQTATATETNTKTETTRITTTAPASTSPAALGWTLLLIILLLVVLLCLLVYKWLRQRKRAGAKLFWQT
jgi:hypothetical protein